jgi:hypothetical protein
MSRLRAGRPEFEYQEGQSYFLSATASIPALRATQLPVQWVPGAIFPGVNRLGREADHLLASITDVKNA